MDIAGLHVGLVGPLPPPSGGMANQTRQLAELLRNEGVIVSLVQNNAEYRPRWVAKLPLLRAFFRLIPYLIVLWQVAGRCHLMHVMANSGWSWHLLAAPAVWIAKLRNTPVIVNYHGGEAKSFLEKSSWIVRMTMCRVSSLIVPSGFLQEVFGRFDLAATIVPNVVDLGRFHNPIPHRATRRHILVARNLEPIYDNETAIRAFSLVRCSFPEATLTVAGSGPSADSLQALVKDLDLEKSVIFTGRLDRDGMAQACKRADIALNPSRVDNMPVSILEALACGVPVVSTNVGGIPYVVHDGQTALLVPPSSPEAMAEALLKLMKDSTLAEMIAENGLEEVNKYTWKHVWPVLAEVYNAATRISPSQA